MLILKLFTPFDTFPIQYLLENAFDTSKKVNEIGLKRLYSLIFKVYGSKFIKVLTLDGLQFWVKVQGLKTFLNLKFIIHSYSIIDDLC